ncbi:MAG TPA: transglycosylase SLT domain-containing protein [Gemmatimonadales bacterium]|nr:transglycosylase SLT domain-containing protein [Gemmatimonadales bacterium]
MRPTNRYDEPNGSAWQRLLVRGALLLVTAVVIGALAGWTERIRAADEARPADQALVARRLGSLHDQLESARGDAALMRLELERARAIMESSTKYQIPADLAADIHDIAIGEGIDPALGFQLVKIESSFRSTARSSMDALGYTQIQLATARFYDADVTEKQLFDRETNLRLGFRFLKDLLVKFDHDTHLALLAYNRGPAKVAEIIAGGGDPANGYSELVLDGYEAPGTH